MNINSSSIERVSRAYIAHLTRRRLTVAGCGLCVWCGRAEEAEEEGTASGFVIARRSPRQLNREWNLQLEQ